jgi:hypothetical protein
VARLRRTDENPGQNLEGIKTPILEEYLKGVEILVLKRDPRNGRVFQ